MEVENDFCGFTDRSIDHYNQLAQTIDVLSKAASTAEKSTKIELEALYRSTAKKPKLADNRNEKHVKPFEFGWKRELVYRAGSDPKQPKRNGEVYYYTPNGKKLRSMREIQENLKEPLQIDCFTFMKEPVGVGPEFEIVRDAKITRGKHSASNFLNKLHEENYNSMQWENSKVEIENKNISNEISRDSNQTFSKGKKPIEPCSIRCTNVINVVPTLQCSICLCLYHPECVGLSPFYTCPDNNYVCKNCGNYQPKIARNETQDGLIVNSNQIEQPGLEIKQNGVQPSLMIDPEHLKQCLVTIADKKFIMVPKNVPLSMKHFSENVQSSLSVYNHYKINNSFDQTMPDINNSFIKQRNDHLNSLKRITAQRNAELWFSRASLTYNSLEKVFEYLSAAELSNAAQVSKMWHAVAQNNRYWRNVTIKANTRITNWAQFFTILHERDTRFLDLKKMLVIPEDNSCWTNFELNVSKLDRITHFRLNRCPNHLVNEIGRNLKNLHSLNISSLRNDILDIQDFINCHNLTELRLKSISGYTLKPSLECLRGLTNLKRLSLSLVRNFDKLDLSVFLNFKNLECLEIGECSKLPESFITDILVHLKHLRRLRLEKFQGVRNINEMLREIAKLEALEHLELINIDIRAGFDDVMTSFTKLRKLLIVPAYITHSATTNHLVLKLTSKILDSNLEMFVWVVTYELLNVTQLFAGECESLSRGLVLENGIPILKPVPLLNQSKHLVSAVDSEAVEIVSMQVLEDFLNELMVRTKVRIVKVPFLNTWKQTINL